MVCASIDPFASIPLGHLRMPVVALLVVRTICKSIAVPTISHELGTRRDSSLNPIHATVAAFVT